MASGFPTGFTADSRTRLHLDAAELQYSQLAEHRFDTEAAGAARLHLVTPLENKFRRFVSSRGTWKSCDCNGITELRQPFQ